VHLVVFRFQVSGSWVGPGGRGGLHRAHTLTGPRMVRVELPDFQSAKPQNPYSEDEGFGRPYAKKCFLFFP